MRGLNLAPPSFEEQNLTEAGLAALGAVRRVGRVGMRPEFRAPKPVVLPPAFERREVKSRAQEVILRMGRSEIERRARQQSTGSLLSRLIRKVNIT